jgi:LPS-assembly protein
LKYCLQIVILLCLVTTNTLAEESLMSFRLDQTVRLEADEMRGSYSDERFDAIGTATLRQENLTLHADSIWFDKRSNEAGAKGKVTLLEKGGTLVGDDLLLNFTSGQARLSHAKAHLTEEGFHLSGETIERLDDNNYRITSGDFTACTATPPARKFGASTVDVEVGGYASAKNMVFYLRDIPVFPLIEEMQNSLKQSRPVFVDRIYPGLRQYFVVNLVVGSDLYELSLPSE